MDVELWEVKELVVRFEHPLDTGSEWICSVAC